MGKIIRILLIFIILFFTVLPVGYNRSTYAVTPQPINLDFNPNDFVVDPNDTVVYMTKLGSKTIYAVNYMTNEMKTLALPYPAEKLEIFKDKLYVTQQKMSHTSNISIPYRGGIAVVNLSNFSLNEVISVEIDPYDIAIDNNGYIYITSGSGQWTEMQSYSLETKQLIDKTNIRQLSTIYYNKETSKVYTIDSDLGPRDMNAYQIDNGNFVFDYDSPYHGDYELRKNAVISPDGTKLYNMSGDSFNLSFTQNGDLIHNFSLPDDYNAIGFSNKEPLLFAANTLGGIDVFKNNTNSYLYSLKKDVTVLNLAFKDGLIIVYQTGQNQYYLEYVSDYKYNPFSIEDSIYMYQDVNNKIQSGALYSSIKNIPNNSIFSFEFTQNFTLNDPTKIKLIDGSGNLIPTDIKVDKGKLIIDPKFLYENTLYTLVIDDGAVASVITKELSPKVVYTFKTVQTPITDIKVSVDSFKEPFEYTFTASIEGGNQPQYKFYILENGMWKVLQDYSSRPILIWGPSRIGNYTFKVWVKNSDSNATFDKEIIFQQSVNVDSPPNITLTSGTTNYTNKNVTISINTSSIVGIKSILLPDGKEVSSSNTTYSVSENGTYKFRVLDSLGSVSEKSIRVSNIDRVLPEINITPNTTSLTTGQVVLGIESNDNIAVKNVKLPDGKISTSKVSFFTVTKNGIYTISVEDIAGNISKKSVTISNIIEVPKPPLQPNVNPIWDNCTIISGKTSKNIKVLAKVNGKVIGSVNSTSTGEFTMKVPKQLANTKVYVYAIDTKTGLQSSARILTVLDQTPPSQPTVSSITSETRTINGKAEKGSTIYVYRNDKVIGKTITNSNGTYTVRIESQKRGTTLKFYAVDRSKNKSVATTVKVK